MLKINGFDDTIRINGLNVNSLSYFSTIENLTYNDEVIATDLSRPLSNLVSNDIELYTILEKMARQLYNKNGIFNNSLQNSFAFTTVDNTKTLNFGDYGYVTFIKVSPGIAGVNYTKVGTDVFALQEGFLVVNKPNLIEEERQLALWFGLNPKDDIEYVKIKYSYTTGRFKMRVVKTTSFGTPVIYDFLNTTDYPSSTFDMDDGSGYKMFQELFIQLYTNVDKANLLNDFYYKNNPTGLANLVCEPTFTVNADGHYYLKINQYGNLVFDTNVFVETDFPLYDLIIYYPNTSSTQFNSLIDDRVFYTDKEIYTRKINFNTTATGDVNWIYSDVSTNQTFIKHRIGVNTDDTIRLEYYNGTTAFPIVDFYGNNLTSKFYGTVLLGTSSSDTLTINSTINTDLIFDDNNRYIKLGGASGSSTNRILYLTNASTGLAHLSVEGDITTSNGNIITENTTSALFNTIATTLSIGGAATTLNLGNTTTSTQTINLGTAITANNQNLNIGTGITSGIQTISLGTGTTTGTQTINIGTSLTSGIQQITIGSATAASSYVKILLATASTSTTSGAFIVSGGVGIGGKLYVGNDTSITGSFITSGDIYTSSTIKIKDINTTPSYYLILKSDSNPDFTADRTLTLDIGNANKSFGLYATALNIGNSQAAGAITITSDGSTARSMTLNSDITINNLSNGYALYASAANTINSEQYLNVSRGGTGLSASSAVNGTLLIGNGTGFTLTTLTGTSNRISVSNAAGSITLNTPQDLHTSANVMFNTINKLTFTQPANGSTLTLADGAILTINDSVTIGTLSSGYVLYASSAKTIGNEAQLSVSRGGTGLGSYTIGDLLIASGATTLSKIADVAIGNVLISGGIGTIPSWGKVNVTSHISGIVPTANGGTGINNSYTLSINGANKTFAGAGSTLTIGASPTINGSATLTLTSNATITTALTVQTGALILNADAAGTTATLPAGVIILVDTTTSQTLTNKTLSTSSIWNGNTVSVSYGGTGATTFTSGQILFGNETATIGTSSYLVWDNTNHRLGLGVTPTEILEVNGNVKATSFIGPMSASGLTGTIPSAVLDNSTLYVGTTAIKLDRSSANLALIGISSLAMPGSTSGTITLQPATEAGTTTITLPAFSGIAAITTTLTGSTIVPAGTTAQRDGTPASGYFRYNTDTGKFEGYKAASWGSVGGGATGGGADEIFIENGQIVTTNYTITSGKNAGSFGPITIADGVTITIPDGSVWTLA